MWIAILIWSYDTHWNCLNEKILKNAYKVFLPTKILYVLIRQF